MSDTNKWADPPQMSKQDEFLDVLSKAPPRDGTCLMTAAILCSMQFPAEGREAPKDKKLYIELLRNLLNGIKHTAEMEMCGFFLDLYVKIRDNGKHVDIETFLHFMAEAAERCKALSLKNFQTASNITQLMEMDDGSK